MDNSELLIYPHDEELPTPETLPDDVYKYIFDGLTNRVVFAGTVLELEHRQIQYSFLDRSFDPRTDDAGYISINWKRTEEYIEEIINVNIEISKKQGTDYDSDKHRNRLIQEYLNTHIKVLKNGSETLGYDNPNPENRQRFIQDCLPILFPDAVITQEQKL